MLFWKVKNLNLAQGFEHVKGYAGLAAEKLRGCREHVQVSSSIHVQKIWARLGSAFCEKRLNVTSSLRSENMARSKTTTSIQHHSNKYVQTHGMFQDVPRFSQPQLRAFSMVILLLCRSLQHDLPPMLESLGRMHPRRWIALPRLRQ